MVSEIFDPSAWDEVPGFDFTDITYHRAKGLGAVRVAFNRPEVRNAFRPHTVDELYRALDHARQTSDVGAVLLTGNGPSEKDGGWAFCSGGDQRIRGKDVVSDLTIASAEHARFKQTDTDVASFDGGFGSAYLAKQVGQKIAREIFFLGRTYTADEAKAQGVVNAVVPHAELEAEALQWAREICSKSPTGQRMSKFAFNLIDDGLVGQQVFAGEATRLAYMTDEAVEGRDSFLEKRDPDWSRFPWYY
jgi:naphthoate synthase